MLTHRFPWSQQRRSGGGRPSPARSAALAAGALVIGLLQTVQAQPAAATVATAVQTVTTEVAEPARAVSYIYHYISTPTRRGNARAISDNRTVVGEYIETFNYQPFVYTPSGGTDDLPLDEGFTGGAATAISPDSRIIGGAMWDVGKESCTVVRWLRKDDGTYSITRIVEGKKGVAAAGCLSEPAKITNAGRFEIVTTDAEGGYIWENGTLTRVHEQPRGQRAAADGTFVQTVDHVSTQHNPDGSVLKLNALGSTDGNGRTLAFAITDYNEVTGASPAGVTSTGQLVEHAVRWNSDGSVVDLNDVTGYVGGNTGGVALRSARAANLAGDIVGTAVNPLISDGYGTPMFLEVLPPVVFVPGVGGSRIIDAVGEEKWLGIGAAHDGLALTGPDAQPGLRADKVLQHECVAGACPDKLRLYGPYADALKQSGMREYRTHTEGVGKPASFRPEHMTTAGCDVSQRPANPNLFLFPYDWRQSNTESAAKLKDFMGCVRKFYTGPVILTAHSMGGLVGRRYVLDNPSYSNS